MRKPTNPPATMRKPTKYPGTVYAMMAIVDAPSKVDFEEVAQCGDAVVGDGEVIYLDLEDKVRFLDDAVMRGEPWACPILNQILLVKGSCPGIRAILFRA